MHELKIVHSNVHFKNGRFIGNSMVKAPCWHQDLNCDFPTQVHSFAATTSSQDFTIFISPHGCQPDARAQYSAEPPVITNKQTGTQSRLSQSLYALKVICHPIAWLICSRNRARLCFLSAAPGVPKLLPVQVLSWPIVA